MTATTLADLEHAVVALDAARDAQARHQPCRSCLTGTSHQDCRTGQRLHNAERAVIATARRLALGL